MKKISLTKKTRNILGHRFGLLLALLGLISVGTFVLEPAALAQVSGDWFPTGSLNTPRSDHTATLLPNGKVLDVGGDNSGSSAELYDPVTGAWSVTGSLNTPRYSHSATLLPDGKVVVVGGWNSNNLNSAELYDPATGTWTLTGSLHMARSVHTATLLQNGKVLVTGGYSDTLYLTNSAELYDPASGTWSVTDSLKTPRVYHTATLLQNGRVLVAGGKLLVDERSYLSETAVANTELYDPATGTWSNTGDQNSARFYHTATLLPNGKVLVAGGAYPGPPIGAAPDGAYKLVGLNRAELYDPATGRWSYTGALRILHAFHTSTLLQNGRVLVDAGTDSVFNYPTDQDVTGAAELYDLATGSWAITAPNVAREFHTATLLQNGLVLVAGGDNGGSFLNSAELYDPTAETSFTLPLTIVMPGLPDAEVGVAYSAPLVDGGHPPYTGRLVKGIFPQGLSDTLASGDLSGTPSSSRSKSITVEITDDLGSSVTGTFTLKIFPALRITSKTLKAGTKERAYQATLKVAGGRKPYTWSLVSGNLPAGLTLNSLTGAVAGIPTATGAFDLIFHTSDSLGGIAETALTLTIK